MKQDEKSWAKTFLVRNGLTTFIMSKMVGEKWFFSIYHVENGWWEMFLFFYHVQNGWWEMVFLHLSCPKWLVRNGLSEWFWKWLLQNGFRSKKKRLLRMRKIVARRILRYAKTGNTKLKTSGSTILIFCEKCWKKFVVPLFCELKLLFLFHFWQHLREFFLVILIRSIN